MSLGLVVSSEKSRTCTRTSMPQSDAIMSADIKIHHFPNFNDFGFMVEITQKLNDRSS